MRGEVARKAFLRSIGPFFVCVLLSRGVCVLVYCIDIVGKLSVFDVVYPKRDTHTHNLLWLITLNRAPPISLNSPADCHLKMAEREKQRNKWMWTSFKRHKKLSSMLVWREKKKAIRSWLRFTTGRKRSACISSVLLFLFAVESRRRNERGRKREIVILFSLSLCFCVKMRVS